MATSHIVKPISQIELASGSVITIPKAIKTDVTSKITLEAYEAIAVPELWVCENGRLTINLLQGEKYCAIGLQSNFSECFINSAHSSRC